MSKKEKRKITVVILPWAGLKEDTQVGPVTFWPWDSSKVQDEDVWYLLAEHRQRRSLIRGRYNLNN